MQILVQLFIILGFTLAGDLISAALPIVIPGSIIGLLLFYGALTLKLIEIKTVEPTASFLKDNMAFFFVPLTVGLMESWSLFQDLLTPILIIVFISTSLTLFASALTTQRLVKKQGDHHD